MRRDELIETGVVSVSKTKKRRERERENTHGYVPCRVVRFETARQNVDLARINLLAAGLISFRFRRLSSPRRKHLSKFDICRESYVVFSSVSHYHREITGIKSTVLYLR